MFNPTTTTVAEKAKRTVNDLCFVINKINNIDVRNASNCEIVEMFLRLTAKNDNNDGDDEWKTVTIEVQKQQKQQYQQEATYLILREQQQQENNSKNTTPPLTPSKQQHALNNGLATKSVQTIVSLMSSPHHYIDDEVEVNIDDDDEIEDDDDVDDDDDDDDDVDTAVACAQTPFTTAVTINDIINEEAHQLFEQCLAPEIDIQVNVV